MPTPRRFSNFAVAIAAGSMVLAPVVQARAQADAQAADMQAADMQAADPQTPNAQPADAAATAEDTAATANATATAGQGGQAADVPTRVGRLAKISGTVSFHTADEDHWDPATLNYPVTTGDAFWTEPQANAAIEIAASRIDMASTTELDVDQLDDHTLTATQAQGETFLDLRELQNGETYTIRTPRGAVAINAPGQYEIAAGDTQAPTMITVVQGSAQVSGDNLALAVQAGQTATITGSGASGDGFQGSVGAEQRDSFLVAELAAETTATATAQASVTAQAAATANASVTAAAPAAVQQMPGGSDLTNYGNWQDSSQYGRVWYPRVAHDWVPYRDGHWAWINPWGWTWVDDEPWGYAPFHYGRWIYAEDRWAWAPVYYSPGYVVPAFYQPVYAPALVGFFGFGAGFAAGLGVGVGLGFGFGWGHIGWCPLGWGEPYRPWFRTGPGYFSRVNQYNVTNINNSVHNVTINNYANAARGASVVPTSAMVNSQRARSVAQPLSRAQFADAHAVTTTPHPTTSTAGVTPRVAQRLGLPNAAQAGAGHTAPGPRVTQTGSGTVPLRQAGSTGAGSTRAAATNAAGTTANGGRTAATTGAHQPESNAATNAAGTHANQAAPRTAQAATATHSGLPPLRTAGSTPRAAGGAPGPAFTPRNGAVHGSTAAATQPGGQAGHNALAANQPAPNATHAAPGPTIAHGNAPTAASTTHGGLPALRTPGSQATSPGTRGVTGGTAQHTQPVTVPHAGQASGNGAGASQHAAAPQTRSYAAPHVYTPSHSVNQTPQTRSTPQSHYQAPRYQAPQQQYHQQQPQYHQPQYHQPQYSAPRYQAPQPRYNMPQHAAPHAAPGGGGRRWIP